ncbi:MAG: metallophosphoesterase family protein [Gemmobacter sp.]
MTRFVHLTDLHLQPEGAPDATTSHDTGAVLAEAVARIGAMDPAPDFVVVSGDLTNHGDEPSYRRLAAALAPLRMPVLLGLGNHDRRAGFHAVMGAGSSEAPLHHAAVHGGLHVIVLDSSVPGRVGGAICDAQFAWLADELEAHPALPKLIAVHHPPRIDPASLPWVSLDDTSTARLGQMLADRKVAAVLSGHIHIDSTTIWNGVPLVVSTGLHSTVDITCREDLRMVEGAGFNLCTWRPSGLGVAAVPLRPERREIRTIDHGRLRAFA